MPKCEIVSIDNDELAFSPKIVNFQNGQLQSSKENKLQCAAFSDSSNGKTIMTVATKKMVYVGEEKNNNDLFYTLLTIRNKKTNKIRLVSVNTVSLNVHIPNINALLDSTLNNSPLNIGDLNKTFGSKRTKRRTEQIERMKLNVSSVEDELRETVKETKIKPEDLVAPSIHDGDKSYRPPMNRNAAIVEQVYDLNDILTQEELDSLMYLATEVLESDFGEDKLAPFVVQHINSLKIQYKSIDKMRKCAILLYIDAIIKFFKVQIKNLKKNCIVGPYPDLIVNKLLEQFTTLNEVTNSRLRPISMRDKAICHVIILGFFALDYKLDLELLSTSIGCGIKKLLSIARVLGAQLMPKTKNTIILKVPLPTPTTVFNKRKRK